MTPAAFPTRIHWIRWTFLLVAVIGIAGAAGVFFGRANVGDPLGPALTAYDRADWHLAETQARAMLKRTPSDPRALRLFARTMARQGNDESAEAIYRRLGTTTMEPDDYFLLGRGLLARGQIGPALASLGAARDAQPDHPETLDALSRYWLKTQTMSDALGAAERLAKQPGWEVRGNVRLALLRSEMFDPAGAAAALTEAMRRDPTLKGSELTPPAARKLLARSWLSAGKPALARASLGELSENPADAEAAWLLGRAYLQEHNVEAIAPAQKAALKFEEPDRSQREPAPFVGAARCAKCHSSIYQSQQSSRHARGLTRTADLPTIPWPEHPVADRHNSAVVHEFQRKDGAIQVETRVKDQAFRALVQFALGSNHQGQSFVAREPGGQWRELRISHYPSAPEWDRTMEHPAEPPDVPGYIGRPITDESVRKCLHCHSTHFRAVTDSLETPVARDHGIGCERCHGPGGNHLAAVDTAFPDLAIAHPGSAGAAQVVALCGECHTAPAKTTERDPGFLRYQASGLVLSRCYTESGDRLSCTTCHDPHQDLNTSRAFYEAICLKCHAPAPRVTHGAVLPKPAAGRACPTGAKMGCLECHMPRIRGAVPRTVFTDHWIKVRPPA